MQSHRVSHLPLDPLLSCGSPSRGWRTATQLSRFSVSIGRPGSWRPLIYFASSTPSTESRMERTRTLTARELLSCNAGAAGMPFLSVQGQGFIVTHLSVHCPPAGLSVYLPTYLPTSSEVNLGCLSSCCCSDTEGNKAFKDPISANAGGGLCCATVTSPWLRRTSWCVSS